MSLIFGAGRPRTAFSAACWAFSRRGVTRPAKPAADMDLRILRRVGMALKEADYHRSAVTMLPQGMKPAFWRVLRLAWLCMLQRAAGMPPRDRHWALSS